MFNNRGVKEHHYSLNLRSESESQSTALKKAVERCRHGKEVKRLAKVLPPCSVDCKESQSVQLLKRNKAPAWKSSRDVLQSTTNRLFIYLLPTVSDKCGQLIDTHLKTRLFLCLTDCNLLQSTKFHIPLFLFSIECFSKVSVLSAYVCCHAHFSVELAHILNILYNQLL